LPGPVFGSIRADTERSFVAMNEALQQRLGAISTSGKEDGRQVWDVPLSGPACHFCQNRPGWAREGRTRGSDQIKAWFSGAPSCKP